jgi:hypothetical protein
MIINTQLSHSAVTRRTHRALRRYDHLEVSSFSTAEVPCPAKDQPIHRTGQVTPEQLQAIRNRDRQDRRTLRPGLVTRLNAIDDRHALLEYIDQLLYDATIHAAREHSATRQGEPTARTAPPSPAGMADTPRNAKMSQDTC